MSGNKNKSQWQHQTFLTSHRQHILMITNHGIHQWEIIPGLPDTGGQNVFVNQFTKALANQNYKITIVNRGGYPHPISGKRLDGLHYKDENRRILYLDDGHPKFIRKEDMNDRMPYLVGALKKSLNREEARVDLIVSHYWDGAKLGVLFNQSLKENVNHIWIPHSLGIIKKRNVPPDQWEKLSIDTRIAMERQIIQEVDGIAATSSIIKRALQDDYKYTHDPYFLPPCIDAHRYHPRNISPDDDIWQFLAQHTTLTPEEIRESIIISEISRTDTTKQKDLLIQSFARIQQKYPETLLVITIDEHQEKLAKKLRGMVSSLGIDKNTVILGSVWDQLPMIYAVTDIYCTPSIMEGFGMSAQEAAATGVPIVASHLVPFVNEYLLGPNFQKVSIGRSQTIKIGSGAIVVQAGSVDNFTHALEILISNQDLRERMGKEAYQITIPYFTWGNMVGKFLHNIHR